MDGNQNKSVNIHAGLDNPNFRVPPPCFQIVRRNECGREQQFSRRHTRKVFFLLPPMIDVSAQTHFYQDGGNMDQHSSSAYTRFPESSRFKSSKADSEDDFEDDREDGLEWLEHDLHGYYDQLTSDSRGRHGLANNDMDEYRHDRAPRSQPPWRESSHDTHTASHSRPQSRQRDPTIRINLPPLPFLPRAPRALRAISTSNWAIPLLLTALTLWIWEIPSVALFWNPAAGLASLSDNLTSPVKGIPGNLGAGLKHQMCKIPGVPILLHCPRPEKQNKAKPKKWRPTKEKPAYLSQWSQVYFSTNDQRRDMVSSGVDLDYETGREVMNHMSRLWANLDQQNFYYKLYDASMQRQCKARLSAYNKLPAQIRFGFLYGSDWDEFMYDLQYSYTDAIERYTQISASFVGVRQKNRWAPQSRSKNVGHRAAQTHPQTIKSV